MTEHEREHEAAKRLDAFVDAAFAFAVTLLVITGANGPSSLAALGVAMGRIPASLGAFALIAMFWMAYRDFGRIAPRRDAWSSLNGLAIVFVVLVYVFPLRMLVESAFVWISGGRLPGEVIIRNLEDLRMLFRVYGMGFVVLAGLFITLYAHAARSPETLGVNAADAEVAASVVQIWLIVASGGAPLGAADLRADRFRPLAPGHSLLGDPAWDWRAKPDPGSAGDPRRQ